MREYRLPVGIMHRNTKLDTFELRVPRGRLRQELSNRPNTSGMADIEITALVHVVSKIGTIDNPPADLVSKLTVSDRDYIHLCMSELIDEGRLNLLRNVCESCGAGFDDSVNAADVAIIGTDAVISFSADGRAVSTIKFKSAKGADYQATVALQTLNDMRVAQKKLQNLPKDGSGFGDMQFELYSTLIVDWNQTGKGISARELGELDLDVFDAFEAAAGKIELPQPDPEVILACPTCKHQQTRGLQFDEWLIPFAVKGPKKS
jgi:hypothetical protein